MSLQATNWAVYEVGPELEDSEFRILMIMADHAKKDGTGVWLSAGQLASYARRSVRCVRYVLRGLEAKGLLRRGDQSIVAHLPGNRRPVVYDLAMDGREENIASQTDGDATEDRGADFAPQDEPETSGVQRECNTVHPKTDSGVQQGCNETAQGCKQGCNMVAHKPIPKEEPLLEPRESRARETETTTWAPNPEHVALADQLHLDVGFEADKFLDRLLETGKTPHDLDAAFRNWLRRGSELNLARQQTTPPTDSAALADGVLGHVHSATCEHVGKMMRTSTLLARVCPDIERRGRCRQMLADLLNDGMAPTDAVQAVIGSLSVGEAA